LKPSLLNTRGPLITISSPYSRKGHLWTTYAKHYGQESRVLVAQASMATMNPSVDMIEEHFQDDPVAAEAEFNAQFRGDLETFIDRDVVESLVGSGCHERPRVALPEAVVALVEASAGDFRAAGTSGAARQGREQGNIAGRQRGHSHLTGEVVQNVLRSVVRFAGHVDSYARA
jgi:hypothetical protein